MPLLPHHSYHKSRVELWTGSRTGNEKAGRKGAGLSSFPTVADLILSFSRC
jgi:hypothetical protein